MQERPATSKYWNGVLFGGLCLGFLALASLFCVRWLFHDSTTPPSGGAEKTLTVERFDGASPKGGMGWKVYLDANNLGTKVKPFVIDKDGSPTGFNGHGHFSGFLGKATAKGPWPWAVLELSLRDNGPQDLSVYNALRFHAKGDGKKYRVRLDRIAVTDNCHFECTFVVPREWTLLTVPFSQLKQPTWGQATSSDVHGRKNGHIRGALRQ